MSETATQPSVYLVIGGAGSDPSAIAYEETGEILETVDWTEEGRPDWSGAGICDHRGAGGVEGWATLSKALDLAEANAGMIGIAPIVRVPRQ